MNMEQDENQSLLEKGEAGKPKQTWKEENHKKKKHKHKSHHKPHADSSKEHDVWHQRYLILEKDAEKV